MDLNLPVTLAIVAVIAAVFGFANWKSRQPSEPLKVRMVNYHVVQMACIVVFLVMAAHLLSLVLGHPFTGRGGQGGSPY
jgi:uncharacterized membrane protein YidH (DUF202 family)